MPLGKPYQPSFSTNAPAVLPSTVSPSPQVSGNGSPEGVVDGVPGQAYVDIQTNDLYVKFAGVQKIGWRLVGKVASVGSQFGKSGNYAGVKPPYTPTGSLDIAVDSSNGRVWMWYDEDWH